MEELQSSLQDSFNELVQVLKAIASPKRLKLLISLLPAPKTFQELMDEVGLARTALSNHLTVLKNASLVDKIHHGYYRITQSGISFLQTINSAFLESQTAEAKEREAKERRQLMESFLSRNT